MVLMIDLNALKDFVDLGGVFILALVMLVYVLRSLDNMDDKLVKILTLMTVVTKASTNYDGIEKLLGNSADAVVKTIKEAEADPV